ncbi:dipeptide epimerase [Hymenobacter sp. BT18]|uniref:enolase C-terminal domain-like protein n=1 Tax=Hymenobacter sp. BT18 TaxID=2835648 RepID=UPI00143E254A|nr:enolase C-terminal domain-like protein [Hymenobacter sp. BT18]QIX62630.1 dipeptide epimerase [Hymenobacter sp. BT18]
MLLWTIEARPLPLRYTWKISRNASDAKVNLLIGVRSQGEPPLAGWAEAAPNVRYGETPERLQAEFAALQGAGLSEVGSEEELAALLQAHPVAQALRFAVEAAYLHHQALRLGQPVWQYLGVPAPAAAVPTAFSLPIMAPEDVASFLQQHQASRFALLKVKVNQESGLALLRAVAAALPGKPLIVDGNEAWPDADNLLQFLEQCQTVAGLQVQVLEQPLPAACVPDYQYLRPRSPYPLFADESVTHHADFGEIAGQFHGVNMKLMKAGGYRQGVEILRQTHAHGLQAMVGCMVETSLGIWSAVQVSGLAQVHDLDGFLVIKKDPFGFVQETQGAVVAQAAMPQIGNGLT